MTDRDFENRKGVYRLLLIISFIGMFMIVARLFAMQVFSRDFYRKASEQNGVRMVPIPAPRGMITDRNGEILVKSRPSYSLYILPYEVKNLDSTCIVLAMALNLEPDEVKNRIKLGWKGQFRPIRLKRDVDFATVSFIEEHSLDFPGIVFEVEPTREYPLFGAHMWGYVGEITDNELEKDTSQAYVIGDIIGKDGLEKQYEQYLRGSDGIKYLEVTSSGRVLGELKDKPSIDPVRGSALKLEIDWDLQELAEQELYASGSGSVVGIDPRDGAVRILSSVPNFDANIFSGVITTEAWNAMMSDSLHPLFSRAIKGTYPPGSTFKLVTAIMGLERHLITTESRFAPCHGAMRFGNRVFKCWKPEGHGSLTLKDAIIQSCDVFFYQLGQDGGIEQFSQVALGCHLGTPTGIDLPGELGGVIPTIDYLDRRHGKNGWTKTLVVNFAIGQGEVLVTPLQMAMLYAALGDDGNIYRPRIVSEIFSPNGDTIKMMPELAGRLPVSNSNIEILKEALIGVVSDPHGTAHQAGVKGVLVAGKTGTAQNPHGNDHAWFVCFAPADNPEIALAIMIENAGHGGSVAAPVAGKILARYFGLDTTQSLAATQLPGH